MSALLDGDRLNRLRLARGMIQSDLANRLNVSIKAISEMENGRYPADDQTLQELGEALDCDPELLGKPLPDFLYSAPMLRAYADAPMRSLSEYIADTLLAYEAFETLGLMRLPDRIPVFNGDLNNDEDIDDYALDVREAAQVETGSPVRIATRAAERLGCIVLPLESELGKHLGMSMLIDGVPVIRVSRPTVDGGIPGDRQRFTLAHELGHVTLHATCAPPNSSEEAKAYEKQAHRFAGAFLLPGDAFLSDLDSLGGRVTLTVLSKMKERWGVSIKAMVVRLQGLRRVEQDQARSLYKQISARGWNKQEPVRVRNENARWLDMAMRRRLSLDVNGEVKPPAYGGLGSPYFDDWNNWNPPEQVDATVLSFDRPRRVVSRPASAL